MKDSALSSLGAYISLATSSDERFPPENMLDGSNQTFWTTTGMYPQEFAITLPTVFDVTSVTMKSFNVRRLHLKRSIDADTGGLQEVEDKELQHEDSQLQATTFNINSELNVLHFTIKSGYDHFCAIHNVIISGNAIR